MLKVVELFSGIGAQRMALTLAGIPHEVVAVSEINKPAIASYTAIHGDCPNLGDIRGIEKLPECDLVTYSFPCQDLSIAGNRKGMGEGTRSGLVWEVLRLLESAERRPEWLLMENVPLVLTAPEWPVLVERLFSMGYRSKWAKLDSSDFGSAQKRVRAFMVSRLDKDPPDLPLGNPDAPPLCIKDIMEPTRDEEYIMRIPLDSIKWRKPKTRGLDEWMSEGSRKGINVIADWQREGRLELANRCYASNGASPTVVAHTGGNRDIKVVSEQADEYRRHVLSECMDGSDGSELVPRMEEGDVCPILTPNRIKRQNGPRYREPNAKAFTVTSQDHHGAAYIEGDSLVVSVLTPRECWRLMGFPDWAYDKAEAVCSKTQLYNQAGNSIVVDVLMTIFRSMFTQSRASQKTLENFFRHL